MRRAAVLAAAALGALVPALPLAAAERLAAAIGEHLFRRNWVSAPASTKADDGLGPLFTAASCAACHPGGRGGGSPVVRFGNGEGGDPVYGRQLQPFAVASLRGEATASLRRAGGRREVRLAHLAYGPLAPGTHVGLRRPPDLAGIAAAEALDDDAILANEGVAGGRVHRLPDGRIGRFGWKASTATVAEQIAAAFSLDMGLSTAARPDPYGDCTPAQRDCLAAPTGSEGGRPEIAPPIVEAIAAYLADLRAPAPPVDAAGSALFGTLGCAACHRPQLSDQQGRRAALFSDLLLHDMGPSLDDGIAEPGAPSSSWRTAPLTGLGRRLEAGTGLLHDGRATQLSDAIEAHGGDAASARDAYLAASAADKSTLAAYLKGL